ncbi:hypothetical protein SMJ63A_20331 [Stenotrophomonas geniculata]
MSGIQAGQAVALDYPQAEPLRGWQAFGQSKGGGDRRRRATGDICRNACHPRSGPDPRDDNSRRYSCSQQKTPAETGAFRVERR